MIDGKPVILGQDGANNGCDFYRVKQPLTKIIEKDLFPCSISSYLQTKEELELWIDKSDILVTQLAKSDRLLQYMTFCRENRIEKKFVIDYDDNIFKVSPYNPSYFYHGVEEVDIHLPNGETVKIKDGKDGFDLEDNRKLIATFCECMKLADIVTTPTSILGGLFKKLNRNVRVIPNFLDLSVWNPLPLIKGGKVRIVWQGGWSHFEDWSIIEDPLKIIMEKYTEVVLVIMGTDFKGHLKSLPQDRIELHKWVSIDVYPHKFKTLNADIGICPLYNNEFNTCKSELKWEEYSSLEIPCVASNIPPYSLRIEDGDTGFLCSDTNDWIEVLSKLIESKDLRVKIGKQSRKHIEDNYDLDKEISQYVEVYNSLFKKELILT